MFYRPLQLFTIAQASAVVASILVKLPLFLPLEWVINISLGLGSATLLAWLWWFYQSGQAMYIKFWLLAIALGVLVGVWL